MINIGQDAPAGFAALGGDEPSLAEAAQRLREAPDLRLRRHAHGLAQFQQDSIAVRRGKEINRRRGFAVAGIAGGADRRRGDLRAADRGHPFHIPLRGLQALLAAALIVHDPLGEADGTRHDQAGVGDPLLQIFQRVAVLHVRIEFGDPGFDCLVTGSRRDFHELIDRPMFTVVADRAGIQAIAEWFLGRHRSCRAHGSCGQRANATRQPGTASYGR